MKHKNLPFSVTSKNTKYFRAGLKYQFFFLNVLFLVIIKQFTVLHPSAFIIVDADLTVIGSGPGGYVAAIKAAQLGFKVRFRLKLDVDSFLFGKS